MTQVGLHEVRTMLEGVAARFRPAELPADACAAVVAEAAVIEKLAATVKALAAARVAETELWKRAGDRSPAHRLAREAGTSVRDAQEAIAAGQGLASDPAVDSAARRGELSTAQAAAIIGAGVDDAAELVAVAKRTSLGELREECLRARAARRDEAENHRRIKAGRRLRTWTDAEGGWNLSLRDTPEVGAEIMAVLGRVRDRIFRAAAREGRREPSEAYAADALRDVVRRAAAGGGEAKPVSGTKVVVRIDWDAFIRGWPIEGEVCEIAGIGPVPVSLVHAMVESGDAFLAAVVTRGVDVHTVAHLGRRAIAVQQTGLDWSQPTCMAEPCTELARLQIDHRHDWADTRITLLRWLDRLCPHHHDRKTREGWALVEGAGRRPMVPPDDPRHPRHRERAGPEAA